MPRVGAQWRSPHGPVEDLPGEEWRDFEEFWEVSNLGRFKAKARAVERARGIWQQRERLLTPHPGGKHNPGESVRYQRDGELQSRSLYRVMWEAFDRPDIGDDQHLTCEGPLHLDNLRLKEGGLRSYRDSPGRVQ